MLTLDSIGYSLGGHSDIAAISAAVKAVTPLGKPKK